MDVPAVSLQGVESLLDDLNIALEYIITRVDFFTGLLQFAMVSFVVFLVWRFLKIFF